MSSRFLPSLLSALWADLPLPEWLPAAADPPWRQTILALTQLWREAGQFGVVISSPVPWLPAWEWHWQPEWQNSHDQPEKPDPTQPDLRDQRWLFTPDLTPATVFDPGQTIIPLLPKDPIRQERFLLLMTPVFSAIAAQGEHPQTGQAGMMVSFEPEVLQRAWQALQTRIQQVRPDCLCRWDSGLQQFPFQPPHPRVIARFSSLLLMTSVPAGEVATVARLPASVPPQAPHALETGHSFGDPTPAGHLYPSPPPSAFQEIPPPVSPVISDADTDPPADEEDTTLSEVELLRALIHEVKTPLATIRTLVRLLLRRQDFPADARKHLERIDRECSEQIDRFSLFFQATEIDAKLLRLESIALVDLLRQKLPQWQDQVQRRGSTLEWEIPDDLPDVVSDPKTLDAVLSGLVDRIARTTPPGSKITAQLLGAGEQVKLQFQVTTEATGEPSSMSVFVPPQAIGQLLVLQPDTGAVSLSIPVTQTLLRALGGYLTIKHRAQQGEIVKIYLPRQI